MAVFGCCLSRNSTREDNTGQIPTERGLIEPRPGGCGFPLLYRIASVITYTFGIEPACLADGAERSKNPEPSGLSTLSLQVLYYL